jgi:hypothetical protein
VQAYRAHFRPAAHPYFLIPPPYSDFDVSQLDAAAFKYWRAAVVNASWDELALQQLRTMGQPLSSSRECLVARALELTQDEWTAINTEVAARDLYQDWQRWVGLYPLSAAVVQWRIRAAQRNWRAEYGGPFMEPATLYYPNRTLTLDPSRVSRWFADSYHTNPLQLPQLPRSQLSQMVQAHAQILKSCRPLTPIKLAQLNSRLGNPS